MGSKEGGKLTATARAVAVREDIDDRAKEQLAGDRLLTAFMIRCWPSPDSQRQ